MLARKRGSKGEKPLACQWKECGYSASQAGHLKNHTRLHTGAGLLPCQWYIIYGCAYSASTPSHLKQHTRTHTGEELLPCQWDGCEHSAATAHKLTQHQFSHRQACCCCCCCCRRRVVD